MDTLLACHQSLEAMGISSSPEAGWRMLRRVSAFGMTLARLDIRQDASRHTETLAAVTSALGLGSYADWDEQARRFPPDGARGRRPLIPADLKPASEVQDVLATFRMIARTPAGSLGAYVITMARNGRSRGRAAAEESRVASPCAPCRCSRRPRTCRTPAT